MWNSKHIFTLLESNAQAGGVKALSVTELLKSANTSQDPQMIGCFDFLIYVTQKGMLSGLGVFFPPFF